MKLNWLQKTVLGALINSSYFVDWVRERALVIPLKQKTAIADRLKVNVDVINAIEFELHNRLLNELKVLVGK